MYPQLICSLAESPKKEMLHLCPTQGWMGGGGMTERVIKGQSEQRESGLD